MPQKYVRRDGLPLLVRHTGATTLPQDPPRAASGPTIVCLHDAGLQSSVFSQLLDTTLVVSILFWGTENHGRIGTFILSGWSFKFLVALCDTPLFYLGVWVFKVCGLAPPDSEYATGERSTHAAES